MTITSRITDQKYAKIGADATDNGLYQCREVHMFADLQNTWFVNDIAKKTSLQWATEKHTTPTSVRTKLKVLLSCKQYSQYSLLHNGSEGCKKTATITKNKEQLASSIF